MRKYIKSMRENYDNNSVIFREAKKMFHYDPTAAQGRHHKTHKQHSLRRDPTKFKDDFSSVKDLKHEPNEINESSWIAKLVNGIEENSLQDLKAPGKGVISRESTASDGVVRRSNHEDYKSIRSENVVIIVDDDEKLPLSNISNIMNRRLSALTS